MARIVCIAGSQPAFGKTTTAVNLACNLAMADRRVLLVDWNPKADAARQLRISTAGPHPWSQPLGTTAAAGEGNILTWDRLHVIAGRWDPQAVSAVAQWPSEVCQANGMSWSEQLCGYDLVLIDCPSDAGSFLESALWAADEVLLPLRCEHTALRQVPEVVETVRRVHRSPGKSLDFGGVLLTHYDESDGLAGQTELEVRDFFGEIVFETVIPRDEAVPDAVGRSRPLMELAPGSRAAWAYVELCMEVLGR